MFQCFIYKCFTFDVSFRQYTQDFSVIGTCTSGTLSMKTHTHTMLFEVGFTGNAQAFQQPVSPKFNSAVAAVLCWA